MVIPAWNEAGAIAGTIAEVRAAQPDVDILVVDDGSGDGTAAVAVAAGAAGGAAALQPRRGWRDAHRLPLRHARGLRRRRPDRRRRPARSDLPAAAARRGLEHSDVVIGARFAGEGDYAARGPRRWAMRMLAARALPARRHPAHRRDERLPRRQPARRSRVFADHYPAEYLGDTVESLVIALRVGCTVSQHPVHMRPRTDRHGEPVARCGPRPTSCAPSLRWGLHWCAGGPPPPRPSVRRSDEPGPHPRRGRGGRSPSSCCSRCCAASACGRSTR